MERARGCGSSGRVPVWPSPEDSQSKRGSDLAGVFLFPGARSLVGQLQRIQLGGRSVLAHGSTVAVDPGLYPP